MTSGAGGTEQIDTAALRGLAGKFDSEIGKHLDDAKSVLSSDAKGIEYSNFTSVSIALAAVYVEACNFAIQDVTTKRQHATDFGKTLVKTAEDWDKAEHANTVQAN